jgi:hypothetical protein
MASYKQIVLDIKDYISMETSCIEHLLDKELPYTQKETLRVEAQTLKDILDIIRDGGK